MSGPHPSRGPAPRASPAQPSRLLETLVGMARVLAGGLVVLAVVVLGAPLVLGGPGAGVETVVGHLVAAGVAVAATALAAHRRTPAPVATVAALAVPVTVVVLLGTVWWS